MLALSTAAATIAIAAEGLPPASSAEVAFVRVDQIGYAASSPKRAYLISRAPETGARFAVRRADGTAVLWGTVGAQLGAWSSAFPHVYAIDFDGLQIPGTYSITVAGGPPASSPAFAIAEPAGLYAQALANALGFYRSQRDGPRFIRSALRTAPGHLNDRHARTYVPPRTAADGTFAGDLSPLRRAIDASGGWWDAGDYLKFVETTSYTVDLLLAGIRDFPAAMGPRSHSDFTAEAAFGLAWLLRMWDDRTRTMYFQVGIAEGNGRTAGDHDLWRLPQADDRYGGSDPVYRYIRHRPAFRAGPGRSPVSPNLAGRDAAAFALCFQVLRHRSPALAARCLRAGEHVFALANTHPLGLVTAVPWGFYPETEWRDDMELGAAELARALTDRPLPRGLRHTSPRYYLRAATGWARAYMRQPDAGDPLNLYDVSGLAHYELYRVLEHLHRARGLAVTGAMLRGDLHRQLAAAIAHASLDPFGAGYPWSAADTASHLAGLSVTASEYASLTGDPLYRTWAVRWLDDVLGANPWGASFIIGDGSTFPRCPQHQVANLAGSLTGSSPVLAGAVVEGPAASAATGAVDGMRACPPSGTDPFGRFDGPAVFRDDVQSFTTVEPAIDLTASSPLMLAWQTRAAR